MTSKILYPLLALSLLLAACTPAQPVTPNPQEVQQQAATIVALTMAAQSVAETAQAPAAASQEAALTPQPTPTSTPLPIPTFTPFPTATPFVVVPPTSISGGGGGAVPTAKPQQYACAVVAQRPEDGTKFKPGDSFDVEWVIKNTGTKTWEAGYTFAYFKGEAMSTTAASTLGVPVKPGETITKRIEVTAPNVSGRDPVIFVMWWAITGEGAKFCTPFIAISVQRPG
ncbi:MAG: NBR1-Ig-like domain-containing protein [Anaerolineae bacterium]